MRPRVALVTAHQMIAEARDEHEALTAALGRVGVEATTLPWTMGPAPFAAFDATVIRSPWDYVGREGEVLAWADAVPRLFNDAPTVRWNAHKSYLLELEARGVRVVPTTLVRAGEALPELGDALDRLGGEAVLKPAVSAGAHDTMRFDRSTLGEAKALLARITQRCDAMLQPFERAVDDPARGERCVVMIDGEPTHAVQKEPILTTQSHGVRLVDPTDDEVAFARQVVAASGRRPLYARVDTVRGDGGRLCLMELELFEPCLFLPLAPHAADALARAIARRVAQQRSPH